MASIGSSTGIIKLRVQKTSFLNANWSSGQYIRLIDGSDSSIASSGFIYISSENVSNVVQRIYLKVVDENSFPTYYISPGSYFVANNSSVNVLFSGSSVSINENGVRSVSLLANFDDDESLSRHDLYNRNVNGTINSANPFNNFLPNSIFSNIDKSWVNSDSRSVTYMGSPNFYNSLIVPITKRHGLAFGFIESSSARYMDSSGSESVRSIVEYKSLQQAYTLAGKTLPSKINGQVASGIKIVKFSNDIPNFVSKVKFASTESLFKKCMSLPMYAITYTRKIGVFSSAQYGDSPFVCSENLPISGRLSGISASTDLINFMYPNERGHAIFAWDGNKSIFLGFTVSNIINTGIDLVNESWDGVVKGFNSQGARSSDISNSQNLLISFFSGYQLALEENIEDFNYVLTSTSVWQDGDNGGGLSLVNDVFDLNETAAAPIFSNPTVGRKRFIQPLRQ